MFAPEVAVHSWRQVGEVIGSWLYGPNTLRQWPMPSGTPIATRAPSIRSKGGNAFSGEGGVYCEIALVVGNTFVKTVPSSSDILHDLTTSSTITLAPTPTNTHTHTHTHREREREREREYLGTANSLQ